MHEINLGILKCSEPCLYCVVTHCMYFNNCAFAKYGYHKSEDMSKRIFLVADRESGRQLQFQLSAWPVGVPSKQDTCMCHRQGDTA
jgi:hypothetical protein